ncbi:hypothetical protein P3T27_006921 [Kitasatospora sp. MAA19]|nr:hypothetical protein [Kitasatospora sp. MAA19]
MRSSTAQLRDRGHGTMKSFIKLLEKAMENTGTTPRR